MLHGKVYLKVGSSVGLHDATKIESEAAGGFGELSRPDNEALGRFLGLCIFGCGDVRPMLLSLKRR